jgi:predicted esterase
MSYANQDVDDPTLHLPRILCLHGGGTNAKIFRAQCRGLINQLQLEFRLVFAEGPFVSEAGPEVTTVYRNWGPFKRWFRWRPEHPETTQADAMRAIDESLEEARLRDTQSGATGEWMAILGFSQGAKLCASLLYRQQVCKEKEKLGRGFAASNYRFGVILAGRAPLISLESEPDSWLDPGRSALPDASQITDVNWRSWSTSQSNNGALLRIPSLHVHGMRDPGLLLHSQLFQEFCEPSSRILVQWDGDHRVPLKSNDVFPLVQHIRELARDSCRKGPQS